MSQRIMQALLRHAATTPDHIALQDAHEQITYRALVARVQAQVEYLQQRRPRALGLLADNGCNWVIVDLAAYLLHIPIVPLPIFFSTGQLSNTVRSAGIDLIVTDRPKAIASLAWRHFGPNRVCAKLYNVWLDQRDSVALPADIWKITFTSGSTGDPKGVCLAQHQLETVAMHLRSASAAQVHDRHLCMLPLSTLLENVGGLYAALLAGATVCVPGMAELGITGSSGLQPQQFLNALQRWQPTTGIVVPQLLHALVALGRNGAALPTTLRYLAVGGAPIAAATLQRARALGLPVHEGYGLSECASVIAVNRAGAERIGSVGKPLPHVQLAFAGDGEIIVHGVPWHGYLGATPDHRAADGIATGDIGYLDVDGFLFITGRKKNLFITAFGRNVAPEWVERELLAQESILQAAVFGEGRASNCAVIVATPTAGADTIVAAVRAANAALPDYAQIGCWLRATEPFSPHNEQATANGRPRRDRIFERYADDIDALYATCTRHAEFLSATAM